MLTCIGEFYNVHTYEFLDIKVLDIKHIL